MTAVTQPAHRVRCICKNPLLLVFKPSVFVSWRHRLLGVYKDAGVHGTALRFDHCLGLSVSLRRFYASNHCQRHEGVSFCVACINK